VVVVVAAAAAAAAAAAVVVVVVVVVLERLRVAVRVPAGARESSWSAYRSLVPCSELS
jgi:hypothetical protein